MYGMYIYTTTNMYQFLQKYIFDIDKCCVPFFGLRYDLYWQRLGTLIYGKPTSNWIFLCKQNRTFELGKTGEMSITDSGFSSRSLHLLLWWKNTHTFLSFKIGWMK